MQAGRRLLVRLLFGGRGGVLCSITFHVYGHIHWFCITSVNNTKKMRAAEKVSAIA
jgi:hypothetical protein